MRISDGSSDVCSSDLFEKAEPAPIRKVGDEPGLIALESAPSPVEGHVLAPTPATFRGDALIWDRLASRSLFWGVPGGRGLRIDFPDTPWVGMWQKPGAQYHDVEIGRASGGERGSQEGWIEEG